MYSRIIDPVNVDSFILKVHCFKYVLFIFQLQLMYNIILGEEPKDEAFIYNLRSDHLNKSCAHLTPHMVITILLTVFPVLYFTSPGLLCNY